MNTKMKKMMVVALSCAMAFVGFADDEQTEAGFQKAFQEGRYLAAERIYRVIGEKKGLKPMTYYQAALISSMQGKDTLYKDRLSRYLRAEPGWTAEKRIAAWNLTRRTIDASAYLELMKNEKPSPALRDEGLRLIRAFREAKRPAEVMKVADAYLAKFTEYADKRDMVLPLLQMSWENQPNYSVKQAVVYAEKYPLNGADIDQFVNMQRGTCNGKWCAEYMVKNGELLLPNNFWWAFSNLHESFLDKDRKLSETAQKARDELAKKCFALEDKLPKDNFDYQKTMANMKLWYRHCLGFSPATSTNQYAQLCLALVDKLAPLAKEQNQKNEVQNLIWSWGNTPGCMTSAVLQQLRAKYEKDFFSNHMKLYWEGGAVALANAQKSAAPILAMLNKYPNDTQLAWEVSDHLCRYGEVDYMKKYMADYARRDASGRGDVWLNWLTYIPTNKMPVEAKAAFMLETAKAVGSTPMFKWMVEDGQIKRWKKDIFGYKAFDPVVQQIRAGFKLPPLRALRLEIQSLKRESGNKCPARAMAIIDETLKLYPERYPMAGKTAEENADYMAIWGKFWYDLGRSDGAVYQKLLKVLPGRMWEKFDGNWMWELMNHRDYKPADRKIIVDEALVKNPNFVEYLANNDTYVYPSNTVALPQPFTLKNISAAGLMRLTGRFRPFFAPKFISEIFTEFYKNRNVWDEYKNYPWDAHNRFWEAENQLQDGNWALLKDKAFIDSLPWDAMAERCLTSKRGLDREMNFLIIAYRYGRGPEMKKRYLEYLKTCDARYRFEAVRFLLCRGEIIRCADGKSLEKEKDEFWPFVRDWYLPYFKGLSNADALLVDLGEQRDDIYYVFDAAGRELWRNDKDVQALVSELSREYVRLYMAGMRGGRRSGYLYARVFDEDLASGQNLARLPVLAAGIVRDVEIGREKAQEWVKKLQEKGLWEVLFTLTGTLQNINWWGQEAANGFAKIHASITSKIPGIYPVTEKDPAYPLYVAADEYSQSAHEKAWELLKKNVTVFERVAGDLPPEFTAWALEQLLRDRGAQDVNLGRARDIATRLLQNEGKLTPDFAASLLLIRAESYRTQQNFEAAKLEYQSIRDNPAYHATPSGKKAMFRATDLQIDAGNIEGVEQTLEYWLSQNDREVVAQAHYFLAKIAFSRKDYDETIKQLRQVFAINFTHVEGRFLQGQWKLATNNEVDDTEVLIGDLSERSFIRPGNQLTVTVQDANLNVAGGGASIPVIVTTKPGGDWERMNLYQSVRDPQCFKGSIDIELGKANPSNLTVQVRGDDIVSYTIDPKFLAERGLAPQPTKSMRVVDDGKLAIGAGAPKASEKKTEKTVKDLLEHTDSKAGAVARALRPGNPFYVMVKDRDCSFGGSNDEVRVTVTTSSGDKIEGFTLLEEKPFTGVFRGRVTTALPPPRAFASDTATGFNPGDVINSRRDGGWQSLSDSQPGKWFAVDTMGAHIFSNITMTTKSLVDIPSVKLTGLMGGKTIALGSLPKADTKSRIGLHRQIAGAMKASRIEERRAYFENNLRNFPDAVVSNLTFRLAEKNPQPRTFYYHGAFMQPEGVEGFRMRIVPVTESRDSLRGASLTVLVDDTVIFDGWDTKLANALVGFDFLAGCHKLEVFASVAGKKDEFDLLFDEDGQEPKPMPQEWFDVVKYPEIKEFVKDFADIVKTNGCLVANFVTPIRLRTFKWEFVGVKTPYVSVDGISATNDKGEKILPVETDFSDSLNNDTLEVAPGDRITVRYDDQRTSSGHKKSMQAGMNSQFNDGSIGFFFEEVGAGGGIQRYEALRYQPGDSLVIQVRDPDLDVSDDADTVDVKLVNIDGKEIVRTLTEVGGDDEKGVHTGVFMSLLKTCHESDTNATAKVLRTRPTDILTISYDDRENTSPGVPFLRKALITATKVTEPTITLFNTRKHKVIDNSQRAQDELARIRHRPGNENVKHLYTNVLVADPMTREESDSTNAWPVCLCAGVPVRINDRSRARHRGSFVTVEAVAHSELARAKAENREPAKVRATLGLGGGVGPFRLVKGQELPKVAEKRGTFNGFIPLSLGPIDLNVVSPNEAKKMLCVTGSDQIDITLLDPEGKPCLTRTVKLVTDGEIGLVDSTFNAERSEAHIGEYFYVKVNDADRDATDEPDRIRVDAVSSNTGVRRPLILTETMPHSGIFTGRVRPVIFNKGETIPNVCTGGVATVREAIAEDRFAIDYGDSIIFKYKDDVTLPSTPPRTLSVTGTVFRGANGSVRTFSKHFSDRDSAVLVQFRLAECLFEQAKEHRKLKQPEKSAAAIADGKFLLEEALKNFPDSSHIVQGEFLLANLYQELGSEQKEAGNMEKAIPLFQDALSRFAQILGTWPDGEFAARSQYHKAYCLEMLQDYNRAAEEYVKMTYLFPESELVGEATIRLATYYYVKVKRYDIAGHIYRNFQQRFPQHDKAARALFMAGSCYIKQAQAAIAATKPKDKNTPVNGEAVRIAGAKADEMYREAYKTFMTLIDTYRDAPPAIRAQTMYWAGDVGCRAKNYAGAYRNLKRVIFEYPETEWARRARGLLLQEAWSFKNFE